MRRCSDFLGSIGRGMSYRDVSDAVTIQIFLEQSHGHTNLLALRSSRSTGINGSCRAALRKSTLRLCCSLLQYNPYQKAPGLAMLFDRCRGWVRVDVPLPAIKLSSQFCQGVSRVDSGCDNLCVGFWRKGWESNPPRTGLPPPTRL